jgi:hypothetical protein
MSSRIDDIMDQLIDIASTPIRAAGYPAKPPTTRIELRGVSVGQLMTALRFSGLVISNDEGTLVIHKAEESHDGTTQR